MFRIEVEEVVVVVVIEEEAVYLVVEGKGVVEVEEEVEEVVHQDKADKVHGSSVRSLAVITLCRQSRFR